MGNGQDGVWGSLSGVVVVAGLLSLLTGCGSSPTDEGTARLGEPLWGEKTEGFYACQSALSGTTALLGCGASAVVYEHSGAGWTQQQELAATGFEGATFALSGDTVAFGGVPASHASAWAQVFVRSGSTWTEQQRLVPESGRADYADVAVSGNTALLGITWHVPNSYDPKTLRYRLTGAVHVFVRSGSVWTEQQRLESDTPGDGDEFGRRVAVSGDTALVSSLDVATLRPVVHVFVRSGNQWTEQQKLEGTAEQELSTAIALSGDTAVVAGHSPAVAGNDNGIGFVFVRSGTTWSLQQVLTAPSAAPPGNDWVPTPPMDTPEAALFGDKALISSGDAAYLFERSGDTWTAQQELFDPLYPHTSGISLASGFAVASFWNYREIGSDGRGFFYTLHDEDPGSCAVDGDCASGHCVDHICCDTECQGPCQSCRAAEKEFGIDGVCGNIPVGKDPFDGCSEALGEDGCGETGFCDGRGSCGVGPRGTSCGAGKVCGTTALVSYACNGSGKCDTVMFPDGLGGRVPYLACARGYACQNGACNTSCASDDNCDAVLGYKCLAGNCAVPLGAPCLRDRDLCDSGHCVDGVCCDSACDEGQCSACTHELTGQADGTCAPIPAGQDPQNECEPDADYPTSCGGDGLCDGAGSCRVHAEAGTVCGGITCEAGQQTTLACTGESRECLPQITDCVAYACDGNVCGTRCADESGCNGDRGYCVSNHTCLETKADSARCLENTECRSGVCADGRCGAGIAGAPSTEGGGSGAGAPAVDDGPSSAGARPDGGDHGSPGRDDVGCSCRLGRNGPSSSCWPLLALLACAALGRRRGAARARPRARHNEILAGSSLGADS